MSTERENLDRFEAALRRLEDDAQPVHIQMSKSELWVLLSQLQLAFRHPANTGPSRQLVEQFAEELAAAITRQEPDLKLLWNMGKVPAFDHVITPT